MTISTIFQRTSFSLANLMPDRTNIKFFIYFQTTTEITTLHGAEVPGVGIETGAGLEADHTIKVVVVAIGEAEYPQAYTAGSVVTEEATTKDPGTIDDNHGGILSKYHHKINS